MAELFHGQWIFKNDGEPERTVPVSFKFEDVVQICGSKGSGAKFENRKPKTKVFLEGGRTMWVLTPVAEFQARWDAYIEDIPYWDFQFSNN
jgi:hypothetical protein